MNILRFSEGRTKGAEVVRIIVDFLARRAVASSARKEQLLWKKMQHSPMTSRRMGWNSGASCSRAASAGWLDILIQVEQIARIIGCFDLCRLEVASVRSLDRLHSAQAGVPLEKQEWLGALVTHVFAAAIGRQ